MKHYEIYYLVLAIFFIAIYLGFKYVDRIKDGKKKNKRIVLHKKLNNKYDEYFNTVSHDKEYYGFYENPSAIKERIEEILIQINVDRSFYLNAVEAMYVFKNFSNEITKSDEGPYYMISKKAAKEFLKKFKSDSIQNTIKELNEIAKEIIPKENEKITINAEELFYRIRNKHIKGVDRNEFIKFFSLDESMDYPKFVITDEIKHERKQKKTIDKKLSVLKTDENGNEYIETETGKKILLTNSGVVIEDNEEKPEHPNIVVAKSVQELVNTVQTMMLKMQEQQDMILELSHSNNETPDIAGTKNLDNLSQTNNNNAMDLVTNISYSDTQNGAITNEQTAKESRLKKDNTSRKNELHENDSKTDTPLDIKNKKSSDIDSINIPTNGEESFINNTAEIVNMEDEIENFMSLANSINDIMISDDENKKLKEKAKKESKENDVQKSTFDKSTGNQSSSKVDTVENFLQEQKGVNKYSLKEIKDITNVINDKSMLVKFILEVLDTVTKCDTKLLCHKNKIFIPFIVIVKSFHECYYKESKIVYNDKINFINFNNCILLCKELNKVAKKSGARGIFYPPDEIITGIVYADNCESVVTILDKSFVSMLPSSVRIKIESFCEELEDISYKKPNFKVHAMVHCKKVDFF